ncbi:hypothetical protein OsI_33410 [Oryza sativa Indica Group]|uniref:Uncharacterized protein n=1 Tax=Oryza sativa subsp. indica TaxID=39946 RepID=B8BGL8_ORYSI|nr:hypothetical protein OsI_33410 [Oryza sativa Indica Group]
MVEKEARPSSPSDDGSGGVEVSAKGEVASDVWEGGGGHHNPSLVKLLPDLAERLTNSPLDPTAWTVAFA